MTATPHSMYALALDRLYALEDYAAVDVITFDALKTLDKLQRVPNIITLSSPDTESDIPLYVDKGSVILVEECLKLSARSLGVEAHKVTLPTAYYRSYFSQRAALRYSEESVKEALRSLWEKLIELLKALAHELEVFIERLSHNINVIKAQLDSLEVDLEDLMGQSPMVSDFTAPTLIRALKAQKKVDVKYFITLLKAHESFATRVVKSATDLDEALDTLTKVANAKEAVEAQKLLSYLKPLLYAVSAKTQYIPEVPGEYVSPEQLISAYRAHLTLTPLKHLAKPNVTYKSDEVEESDESIECRVASPKELKMLVEQAKSLFTHHKHWHSILRDAASQYRRLAQRLNAAKDNEDDEIAYYLWHYATSVNKLFTQGYKLNYDMIYYVIRYARLVIKNAYRIEPDDAF